MEKDSNPTGTRTAAIFVSVGVALFVSSLSTGTASSSLLSKALSLEPSCSPCGLQGGLEADVPQLPSSLEEGAELVESGGSVFDTDPPVTTVTAPTRSRPPLLGPKPQGTKPPSCFFTDASVSSCNLLP